MTKPLNHILCVDDEEDILEVAKIALEAVGGFQVSICKGGKEALARAPELKPDMILLDVMMPGLDGPATYGQLKLNPSLKNVPVAFMTAKVQPKEVSSYIDIGAIGVIVKPFDPMRLADDIRALWNAFDKEA
ncbi:MAG: response regulator [Pseudomonadota bacterium]|nr:response regulator [Pseudomonadota bacterium]